MLGYLIAAAISVWFLVRSRLWKRLFNVKREIRAAIRRRSFAQYYVAVRFRELAGLLGFVLGAVWVGQSDAFSYANLHRWGLVLLYIFLAGVALYLLYLIVDVRRLRRRFAQLVAARQR